ncbi:MAG TPA: DUF2855 family protein [Candidatus Limnocylindrales bacterium]|nr:DUF2855 family protein [Candidatus Limnocylindrales bacterium]
MPSLGSQAYDFEVARGNLRRFRFAPATQASEVRLDHGQVLLGVDCFGMTANNITYGVFGEAMSYWNFFPAPEGWGRIPVWGFAEVLRSHHPAIAQGERIYGYLPMSTHLTVRPGKVTGEGFLDTSPHRSQMHAIYNQYTLVAGDPSYDAQREAEQMVFRPLFMTGFLIDDFLADNGFFGARRVVLSSSSSKTAMAVAFCLSQRRARPQVVGLTSSRNLSFVSGLAIYDQAVGYDDLEALDAGVPTVFVDMAGNGDVLARVHRHFGDNLKYSCQVGGTHWERIATAQPLSGPAPRLFFAPDQVAKRAREWGAAGLQERMGAAWRGFLAGTAGWLGIERGVGREAIERVYLATLEGTADPRRGYVLSMD